MSLPITSTRSHCSVMFSIVYHYSKKCKCHCKKLSFHLLLVAKDVFQPKGGTTPGAAVAPTLPSVDLLASSIAFTFYLIFLIMNSLLISFIFLLRCRLVDEEDGIDISFFYINISCHYYTTQYSKQGYKFDVVTMLLI